ncbi:MAG: hypothetical protein CK431_04350 [Mycobacterium sp.]|nr:MAG: hypothetical protein CK431_04350 [Mycobacterium sp.]
MKLATRQDVSDRLEGELSDDVDVEALLDEASVTVEEFLRRTFTEDDEIPRAVAIVVSRMVARRLTANGDDATSVPDGVSQLGATDYQASFAEPFVSMGVWLNRTDKAMLRRHRISVVSMPVSSDRTPRPLYVDECDI